jgi:glycosyltransferase involved in cell wall biosynthesis
VLAIEDNEAMHFRKELGDGPQVHTVGHFVEIFDVIQQTDEPHVAYLGAMSMGNADTLRFFLREIIPRVLKTIPDFKLFVAGSVCGVLENEVNVIALGEVADVREVFNKAPILVSPTRIGTGIAIKLLSALGHGVPVVTTEVGARGHDDKGGMVVVADNDPYAFADALVALVGDQPRRQKLGLGAAEHAAKWNAAQRLALAKAITAPVF